MSNPIILEDLFHVTEVDPNGKVYIRVSRIVCQSKRKDMSITVDVNTEEWPVMAGEQLTIAIASTLDLEGRKEKPVYDHSVYYRDTLMSQYDYVMFGRVYECSADADSVDKVQVYVSFGGLLMKAEGPPSRLSGIHFNDDVYLLIKRAGK